MLNRINYTQYATLSSKLMIKKMTVELTRRKIIIPLIKYLILLFNIDECPNPHSSTHFSLNCSSKINCRCPLPTGIKINEINKIILKKSIIIAFIKKHKV